MKKALITGVTGQDGSYLADLLLSKGYRVSAIVRRTSTPNLERIEHIKDKLTLIPGDILDQNSIINAIKESDPSELYNLASQSFVPHSWAEPVHTSVCTAIGVTKVLEAIRATKLDIRFYQASSSEMFGKVQEVPQTEKTPFYPRSPYGVAKLYGHWMTVNYRESYGMFACSGILFNHECVSENTAVITRKNGAISIKRVKDILKPRQKRRNIQQRTLKDLEIWDGDSFVPVNCITATKRKKNDLDFSCRIINTRNGVVEVTNHHNMLDRKSKKIKAKSLKVNSGLLHKNFPIQREICRLSREEAVFLGMMTADGWIGKDGKANFANNDKAIMANLEKMWMKIGLGTASCETYKTEYGVSTRARLNGGNAYLKFIQSELYTDDGFKKVPDRILNADRETQLAFLEGYNACDGLKSNPCTYLFKNFKTNSSVLAQGLLFLIGQTTFQGFNITFEPDEKHYGYYSMNLLSPDDNSLKEEKVRYLLREGLGQKEINRVSGISRTFIRKIQRGGHAEPSHHLSKPKHRVKKVISHKSQPDWVFDLETGSGRFMAGVGTMVVSNSPRRGIEFVTRKVTDGVARIKLGLQNELRLGNLDAKRDWGFAGDYVKAMWLMLQQEKPSDYVICTGITHSIRELCEAAFGCVGLNYKDYVKIDPKFLRPAEVDLLVGDCSKAKKELGWEPKVSFEELIKMMVDSDLEKVKKQT